MELLQLTISDFHITKLFYEVSVHNIGISEINNCNLITCIVSYPATVTYISAIEITNSAGITGEVKGQN